MNLSEIKNTVKQMDEQLAPGADGFKTAVLLLALLEKGEDVDALTAFTQLPHEFVHVRIARLKANGVIAEDGKLDVDWWDEQYGGTEFWMHVAVADGLLERVPDCEESTFIAPSDEWPDVVGEEQPQ